MIQPLTSIAIIGGGTAGWMTAAALARSLDTSQTSVTLVESENIGTVGVGEATIPNILQFNQMLGLTEADVMSACDATFKLGIQFDGWRTPDDGYFHPFGWHGMDMEGMSFHHYWLRLNQAGLAPPIEAFSLSAVAAKNGKFDRPSSDPRSPLSRLAYAYHMDASRYARLLRHYSETRGVKRIEGLVNRVDRHAETGDVTHVTLASGQTIEADLFVDCTGFAGLLIDKTLSVPFVDWSHWLPCNHAFAVRTATAQTIAPFTRATAHSAGWQWQIPLQSRRGNGYVFCDAHLDPETARETFLHSLDVEPQSDPLEFRFRTGMRATPWTGNVVAIGLAGGFLEPLESTSIHLIQYGITKLLALFPSHTAQSVERDEYNSLMHQEYEQVRDFLILHYVQNERLGEPFWDQLRHMNLPDSLSRKIDLFKPKGNFFRYDGELFTETSWIAVLLGQGCIPDGYNPIVEQIPMRQLQESLNSMHVAFDRTVGSMASHSEFIQRYAPSELGS